MDYSVETQQLIERMCRNVERKDFVLEKEKAVECLMKTYDLFNLVRPKKVVWYKDIFNKRFLEIARSIRSTWSALNARSAWSALNAGSAWRALNARSALNAGSAWRALNARSAWSIRSALDYDFDWYFFEFEYCQNPDKNNLPNENDKKYLMYSELLMQANEYGMGYNIEFEDTLYCVPTPLVKIDIQNRFHSEHTPAIRWKGGKEFFILHGVMFPKNLWQKIVRREMPMEEILKIKDIDQRTQAIKFAKNGLRDFYKSQNGEKIDETDKIDSEECITHYELWRIPKGEIFNQEVHFVVYDCPSAKKRGEEREYAKGVPKFEKVAEALAWGMSDEKYILTPQTWEDLIPLVNES